MLWETTIDLISIWYYIVILAFMIVGIYGTWKHEDAVPVLWAVSMSVILFVYSTVLEPLVFGYQYYAIYSLEWFMTAIFGILFALLNITYGYNILTEGTVIE